MEGNPCPYQQLFSPGADVSEEAHRHCPGPFWEHLSPKTFPSLSLFPDPAQPQRGKHLGLARWGKGLEVKPGKQESP